MVSHNKPANTPSKVNYADLVFTYCNRRRATGGTVATISTSRTVKSLMVDSNKHPPLKYQTSACKQTRNLRVREATKTSQSYRFAHYKGGTQHMGEQKKKSKVKNPYGIKISSLL